MKSLLLTLLFCMAIQAEDKVRESVHLSMLRHTAFLVGQSGNRVSFGSGFIIGKPIDGETNQVNFVLITADHVLRGMPGTNLTYTLRTQEGGKWQEYGVEIAIRDNAGKELWTKHPNADVAVMYAPVKKGTFSGPEGTLSTRQLVKDADIDRYSIGPGSSIYCAGFPLGLKGSVGFPYLRQGMIASYPLTPMKDVAVWGCDFNGFRGNSGGPVYVWKENYREGRSIKLGGELRGIVGVMIQTLSALDHGENPPIMKDVGLPRIVPAAFVQETVDLLPKFDEKSLKYRIFDLNQ